ncbi:hypothetical protein ABFA07_011688 [Porites harrisoni]
MAGAYQPTTVQNEEIDDDERTLFCNPFHGRREGDLEKARGHRRRQSKKDFEAEGQERVNQWLFTRCVSRQDGQVDDGASSAVPTPAGSEYHLPGRGTAATDTVHPSQLNRAQTIKKKIIKSTENFFGLGDCEEQHANLQRKWTQRRKRHYHKRYGALVEGDAVDGAMQRGKSSGAGSISSYQSSRHMQADPNLVRTLSRRESVASLAWKKVRKMRDEPGGFKSPGKAQPACLLLEAGRSFSPAVMSQTDEDEVDSAFHAEGVRGIDEGSVDDEVFFSFAPEKQRRRKEKPGFLPGIKEEEKPVPAVPPVAKEKVDGPPAPRPPIRSRRGQRIADRPRVTNANRREYGKGMVGRWLNRTIKRKRLTSTVKKQMESLSDHRPFFTYWISFVQTVVLIVGLAVYGFAPIGFTERKIEGVIDKSLAGTLVPIKESRMQHENFWIGPNQRGLIRMGAKFAPCMRVDSKLQDVLQEERRNETDTGCCIKSDGSGCIQTSQKECSRAFASFSKYSKDNKTRIVCGQDPRTCLDPPDVAPDRWDSQDITKWPVCKKNKPNLSPTDYPHMTCEITGRPCCMGNEARCEIVSKGVCDFYNGTWHENFTLCSQVDCISDTCGMLDFHRKDKPDQVYRLWMAIFAHAGIIHLCCTLIFHITIMRDMEKMAGWLRMAIIYIFSGIGGYLYSGILLPYQAEVGPSGSIFGVIACLFVELFQSWQIIARPVTALLKLCGLVLLLLVIGLLPYVDNFAHMIGFVFGFLLAFIFLPYVSFGEFDRRRKQIQIVVCFALVITLYVVGFLVFYIYQGSSCDGCEFLNCIPFTPDFCKPYTLGQNLQPRTR